MKTGEIRQSVTINASAAEVCNVFLNARKHSELSNSDAITSRKVGGKFSIFDGYCSGHNIELVKDRKIVQAWNFKEDGWPENHYSICTFLFSEKDGRTRITFTQTDIPEHKVEDLKEGWKRYYWEPLKTMFK